MTPLLLVVVAAALAAEGREALVAELAAAHGLRPDQAAAVWAILAANPLMGTGPSPRTTHPLRPEQCRQRRAAAGVPDRDPAFEAICGRPHMAPLYDPATQAPGEARVCIDRYEFPDVPCAYPWVYVRAREAAELCAAMGKRLCDAHEWEGACQGRLGPPDYRWDLARGVSEGEAVQRLRAAHNQAHRADRRWATGPTPPAPGVCAEGSSKSEGCDGGSPTRCGSNTYPAGAFPGCVSPLGVYDQHGNAAEHMNLPLAPDQAASLGSTTLGVTEMKGSWFIFETYRAHEDWCEWRAPWWHGTKVRAGDSHRNYHLGFRCCADRVP